MADCVFKDVGKCSNPNQELQTCTQQRVNSIIHASQVRDDGLHTRFYDSAQITCIKFHKNCISSYTSAWHLKRLPNARTVPPDVPIKKKRSDVCAFEFKINCLFCGDLCEMKKDPKNPGRWRRIVLCRTADDAKHGSFKDKILATCITRKDAWSEEVSVRVEGALSDLHAADARYHYDCRVRFLGPKTIQQAASASTFVSSDNSQEIDVAFKTLVSFMSENQTEIWNSVQLFDLYKSYGGTPLLRRNLIMKLSAHFGVQLLILRANGLASILLFHNKASSVFKIYNDDEDDDIRPSLNKVADQVKKEIKTLKRNKDTYHIQVNNSVAEEYVSETMNDLLNMILPSHDKQLHKLMIGNMLTGMVTNFPTSLQIGLGIVLRQKDLIHQFFKFGVVCSYDEVLRFRRSAAHASTNITDRGIQHISRNGSGLVQVVIDNFDTNISSQNGLQSTHSLAMLVTQTNQVTNDVEMPETITRITKEDMTATVGAEVDIKRYTGPKKPNMPENKVCILPLRVMAMQIISKGRAQQRDFDFLKKVTGEPKCPEWNGFNCALNRQDGHSPKPKTSIAYSPLLNMKPADPDTVLTAMLEAEQLLQTTGQDICVLTCDQQLYKVAVDITWVYPELFNKFFIRLGGMHFIMNFIGCVGSLMAETGLSDIMECAFGGVGHMLSGKKYPQNFRALRMVTEELLRPIIQEVTNMQELMEVLEVRATESRTTRLWLDIVIKPVFLMMLFCRAEKEDEWPLHLLSVKNMLPYYFAAGHQNYSRCGLYYLHQAESLCGELLERFLKGEHVTRHIPGIWNGIWSDMMIESTFMKYGKGPGGIIGITLQPNTLRIWALSLHICSILSKDIHEMTDDDTSASIVHKEEMLGRCNADEKDRMIIRAKLEASIDPLDPSQHPDGEIINIVSGKICDSPVNVDKALSIGERMLKDYELSLPDGFHKPFSKQVKTMAITKKHLNIGKQNLYDTGLIYSRLTGLLASGRDVCIQDVLRYELAPVPTSMFTDSGEMRVAKGKSTLKTQLQVEVSSRLAPPQTVIIDGSAILWVVHWPVNGKVQDYVDNVVTYVTRKMKEANVYLIFDRYFPYSIKSSTRSARDKEASRKHRISPMMLLPPQKVMLTVTENKVQLVELIVQRLKESCANLAYTQHKLVVTGHHAVPIEINLGCIIERRDLESNQEEADVIIIHQLLSIVQEGASKNITVLCDDTDVFVLLLHFYQTENLNCNIIMESTSRDRKVVDIRLTVEKHKEIIPHLLAAHAVSGCDTVAQYWGIGKGTAVKKLQAGYKLVLLGETNAPTADVIQEASVFIAACYGHTNISTMTDVRYKVWKAKMSKVNVISAPKLMSLPPTDDAFKLNVLRAHFQVATWKNASEGNPPTLDPLDYGWTKDIINKALSPTMLPSNILSAPDYILKLVRCNCANCSSARCSCASARLPCTMFCQCDGSAECCNEHTKEMEQIPSDENES